MSLIALPSKPSRPGLKGIKKIVQDIEAQYLKSEIKICAPAKTLDNIIEARIHGKIFLLRRLITCGKACKGCPHGPYWYGFYRSKSKFISFYLGKVLPPRFALAKKISISKQTYGGNGGPNVTQLD
jgi:hypothetical protein